MFDSGIFDLPSPTKNHSCAFERILGYYFKMKLKNINEISHIPQTKVINSDVYEKIFLTQKLPTI